MDMTNPNIKKIFNAHLEMKHKAVEYAIALCAYLASLDFRGEEVNAILKIAPEWCGVDKENVKELFDKLKEGDMK